MITLDVSWGPFVITIVIAGVLILSLVAAVIILVIVLVKGDIRKGFINNNPDPLPSAASTKPEDQ